MGNECSIPQDNGLLVICGLRRLGKCRGEIVAWPFTHLERRILIQVPLEPGWKFAFETLRSIKAPPRDQIMELEIMLLDENDALSRLV